MPHPHGHACRCPPKQPDDGLLRFTVDCDHYDAMVRALARIADKPAVTLRVLTTEPTAVPNLVPVEPACSGSLTCPCPRCESERAARIATGPRKVVQPWQPRPSRRAA